VAHAAPNRGATLRERRELIFIQRPLNSTSNASIDPPKTDAMFFDLQSQTTRISTMKLRPKRLSRIVTPKNIIVK
jgi:hypothetical protein